MERERDHVSFLAASSATRVASSRSARDQRTYVRIVMVFLAATTAISLYDTILLVSLLGH